MMPVRSIGALLAMFAGATIAAAQKPAPVDSGAAVEPVVQLSPFTVSAQHDVGYATSNSVGATRVNIANEDVPVSVITLNQQFLDDLAPANIQEALGYVSGVSTVASPNVGQFTLRGFNTNGSVHRDGLDDPISAFGSVITDMATIDRVEVVKGPEGVLYGQHNPGGLVNRISKMPLGIWRTDLDVSVSSFGGTRTVLDTNGLASDHLLAYRVVLAYQDEKNMQDAPLEKLVVNPSFSGKVAGGNAYLRLLYERDRVSANTSPWFADSAGTPSTFLSPEKSLVPLDDLRDFEIHSVDLGYDRPFTVAGNDGAFRLVSRYSKLDSFSINYPIPNIFLLNAAGSTIGNINTATFATPGLAGFLVNERRREQPIGVRSVAVDVDVVYDFQLGPSDHKFDTYIHVADTDNDADDKQYDYRNLTIVGDVYTDTPLAATLRANNRSSSSARSFAWAAQDFIRFLDNRLIFAGGVRFDAFDYSSATTNLLPVTPTTASATITPRVWTSNYGVIFKPVKGVSVFYNHSGTFNIPSPLINAATGGVFKNLTARSDEEGVKLDLWSSKLVLTASHFEITQDNQIVNAVNQPGVSIQNGVTIARGEEVDLVCQPTRNFSVIGGWGRMRSLTSFNSATLVRNRGVPEGASYKAFAKYTFSSGPLRGLSSALGYQFVNDRAGDSADSFNLKPYHTVDAMLSYRVNEHLSLQVNAQNLNDAVFAEAVSRQLVHAGNERNYRFSVRCRF